MLSASFVFVSILVIAYLGSSTAVFAQTLPSDATVGAARPVLPDSTILPARGEGVSFPIPPVMDRPSAVDEGERLFISNFELKGAIDRPEEGIELDDLKDIIESFRITFQGLDQVGEDGFTDEERMAVAGFISAVVDDPDWDNRLTDYEMLVDRLRDGRLNRETGRTIAQMQTIANSSTQHYQCDACWRPLDGEYFTSTYTRELTVLLCRVRTTHFDART
jgi:hypothetical protein